MIMTPRKSLHLAKLSDGIEPGLRKELRKISRVLKVEIRRNLSGAVLHSRSGVLRSSLKTEIAAISRGWALTMGFNLEKVPYARIHELGGRTGRNYATRIRKQPYLRKALVDKKMEIRKHMERFVAKIVRNP